MCCQLVTVAVCVCVCVCKPLSHPLSVSSPWVDITCCLSLQCSFTCITSELLFLTVPPLLRMNMCLLSSPLPAIIPHRACFVEYDHAAASSVLAVHCISGEMKRALCSSFWLSAKVLLVLVSGGTVEQEKWSHAEWFHTQINLFAPV